MELVMSKKVRSVAIAALVAISVSGCAVNPVTGEKELTLISEAQEINMGAENYLPGRQASGGDLVVDPELQRYVAMVGGRIAEVSDRPLPYEFVVINDSTPNAWAMPGGKIAINRGLLTELDDEAELAAVLGHEVVHAAARHTVQRMQQGMLLQAGAVAVGMAAKDSEYADLIGMGAGVAAGLIGLKYGRDAELEADLYGMRYLARAGYDPEAAVDLQETFLQLAGDRRTGWLQGLLSSHPPTQDRVDANRARLAELPVGGERGEQRYREATARIRTTAGAYDRADQGREALSAGDPGAALAAAEAALQAEPREARFHVLRGEALVALGRDAAARDAFDRSIELYPDYFYSRLQRGLLLERLGDHDAARVDLERSVALLPTPSALSALGREALVRGDRYAAVGYLRRASTSDTAAGREAARTLVRIDLPEHPGRYLESRVGLEADGRIRVQVTNNAPLTVRQVVVEIRYPSEAGPRRRIRPLQQTLLPGASAVLETDLMAAPGTHPGAVHAAVVQAALED